MSSSTGIAAGNPDIQSLYLSLMRQEALLKSISDSLPQIGNSLNALRLHEDRHEQLSSAQSKADFIWNCFLQILGVAFVVLFGVFSGLSYISAQAANSQSMDGNQIALLSLCIGSNSVSKIILAHEAKAYVEYRV